MKLLPQLFQLLAPHYCLQCGAEGDLLCATCQLETCPPLPDRCYRCYRASPGSRVCPKCRLHSHLEHLWVATQYEAMAKKLLHAYKFERAQAAAGVITNYLNATLPYLEKTVLITHVPAASSRVRQRGYDHAQLLAQRLARQRGMSHLALLARQGQARQVGATRTTRLEQLKTAFRPLRPKQIKGAHILLVDDVVTTGATLETAAAVLKQAGAAKVDAIIFAQKQ